jgi:hypothetical protein
MRTILLALLVASPVLFGCGGATEARHVVHKPIPVHPVFNTPMSGQSTARPAIQVDILDDSEDVLFRAELYLSVQSSRFPQDTMIILPLNIGDFAGCRKRFVQLPFEVESRDELAFNLLDDDELTSEQSQAIINGCRACGYCVLVAGEIYCPPAAAIINPIAPIAAEVLGAAIVEDVTIHHFENFGTAEYIVPPSIPQYPQESNELSIRSTTNVVPAILKIYAPAHDLPFSAESPSA